MTISALALIAAFQSGQVYTGTLAEKPTADGHMIVAELKPSTREVPGTKPGDRVLSVRLAQIGSGGVAAGFEVVIIETGNGAMLLADRNMDGKIGEEDRVADLRDTTNVTSWDYEWDLPAGKLSLPLKTHLTINRSDGAPKWWLAYPAAYRVEGTVEIDGQRTLVWLPFKPATGTVDVNRGYIGVDTDRDGRITTGTLSPERVNADGQLPVFRIGDRYIAIESADFAARTFLVKERPAADYALIEVRQGSRLADFSFTDFEGRSRKLSDFRGKHVLLDVWGSWCKPCMDDVPMMRDAYERFRDRGLEIVGLDFEMSASREKVRAVLAEKNVSWVNASPETVKQLIQDRLRINSFPTLILLDPAGIVIETRSSELRGKRLITTLEQVFEKK